MKIRPYLYSLLLLGLTLMLSLGIGSVFLSPIQLWAALTGHGTQTSATILWAICFPRTALIALTGMALGGSGATYQGLFRNPLADPFLIGVASGAGLGAILAMSIHWPYTILGLAAVPAAAFVTGLLTVFLVYTFARVGGSVPVTNLILAGVAVSAFATSVTSYLMLRSTGELRQAISWLLGGVRLKQLEHHPCTDSVPRHRIDHSDIERFCLEPFAIRRRPGRSNGLGCEARQDHYHRSSLVCHGRGSFFCRNHRLCRAGHPACGAHLVGRRLSPHRPAEHFGRRQRTFVRGYSGADRHRSSRIAVRDCHGIGGSAILFVGSSAFEESRILVISQELK